jgi:2-dehydro-3-deoxy-L-rhamnonate dehydrogenase (NAD+)
LAHWTLGAGAVADNDQIGPNAGRALGRLSAHHSGVCVKHVVTTSLKGQTAIVTGAARGIGLAIARHLSAAGARVVVWDLDPSPVRDSDIGFEPALIDTVDVADLASVERGVAHVREKLGRIDILVNNAGVNGPTVPTWAYPLEAWHKVLAVDLTGVFHTCRTIAPFMRAQTYGRIINISSIAGKEGTPLASAYSAAKHGVIGFTKSLALELADSGVTANCIAPVITETDLFKEMSADYIAGRKARIPMGRFCSVDEIAAMTAWVASPACSFTTGATFDISGGRATY